MKDRDEFVFFFHENEENGILSNWYPCHFFMDGREYVHTEQYMMAMKALLFKDEEIFAEIMKEKDPYKCKNLGKKVRNFDGKIWDENKERIMYEGNLAKYLENGELKEFLLSTGDKILAEASPYDSIWGIGMRVKDKDICDMNKWKGENLLGKALMKVREALKR